MSTDDEGGEATAGRRPLGVQWHREPEVAARVETAAPINPQSGVPTTGFNAHGGVVMSNPSVYAIYWGRNYGSPATGTNNLVQQFNTFFGMILSSNYMDFLNQYGVAAGAGTFLGSTWIDHDPTTVETFTTAYDLFTTPTFSQRLNGWIDAGLTFSGATPVKPASDEHDLLFVVFLPPEVTVADPAGSTTKFCGFHYHYFYNKSQVAGQSNLFYAVILPGATTDIVTHEMVEAFTDRDQNGWFSDSLSPTGNSSLNYPEIGDVCNSCGSGILTLNGFQVASYWLVDSQTCLQQTDLTPPTPPLERLPSVTVTPFPVPLGHPEIITVSAADPVTGNAVPGTAEIYQYTRATGYEIVSSFTVPGSTPRPVTLSIGRGGDQEFYDPYGTFVPNPSPNVIYTNVAFDLTQGGP